MKSTFFKLNRWIVIFAVLLITIFFLGGCSPTNHPPLVTSIEAKQSIIGPLDSCVIECVAWDEDGDELSYEWSAGKGSINGDGATVAWTAPETEGIYNITVKVTDGNGGEVTDSITITVKDNHPPTITSLVFVHREGEAYADWVTPLSSCHIECHAEDPDDDELNYEWSASGGNISGTGLVITWTAPEAEGLHNITVVVTDGRGGKVTRSLMISVALNPPPIIESLVVTPENPKYLKKYPWGYRILKNRSCQIECIVTGANDELVYEWSDGDYTYIEDCNCGESPFAGEGSVITWTAPDEGGEITIMVIVYDVEGNMASKNVVFQVETCASCMG